MRRSLICTFVACFLIARSTTADEVDFVRDVRPIISENCVFCHGPDEQTREGGLRLDTADGLASVVDADAPDTSELLRRMVTDDPDERMPPPDSNRTLSDSQVELIRRWIAQGAVWQQHWSFQPLVSPPIPNTKVIGTQTQAPVIRNPIDSFVQAKLAQIEQTAAPEADKATLIRRLSLDLTGLPPKPEDVDAFIADESPDAYEKLVDRLLDSPAYGQRMAWDWLDAARYADSNGYQGDGERTMWPWRDWVVDAFNRNLPYDQFTVWQLAGDLLPSATDEQRLATGFARNHMINGEGGRIAEENRVEYVMDMAETMGTVWLGLTLNCCRCHDHKYDPITNEEYYRLFAFFNQTPVDGGGGSAQTAPVLPVPDESQRSRGAELNQRIAGVDQSLADLEKALAAQQPDWEAKRASELASSDVWNVVKPDSVQAMHQSVEILDDSSVLASGENPVNDSYTAMVSPRQELITGIRLEAIRHESMTHQGLARSDSGNFVLTSFEVTLIDSAGTRSPLKIVTGEATYEQGDLKITKAFDSDPQSGWAVYEGRPLDRDHAAVFAFDRVVNVSENAKLEVTLKHDSVHRHHNLGRFRLSLTSADKPSLGSDENLLAEALRVPIDQRTDEMRKRLADAHRQSNSQHGELRNERERLVKEREALEQSIPKVMVMADREQPRETFILERGLYNKPGEKVTAGMPSVLRDVMPETQDAEAADKPHAASDADDKAANRLSLATQLVDPRNPLTARVTVNRLWQQVFGVGLVKTTEDFGTQGEIPVHRELLDWLAATFRDGGWDVKGLMRLMVTSHTYRQSSKITSAEMHERDPENRLLWRAPRYRLPSWMLRDQALMASGLLSPAVGGPAVNSYQPPGVWEEASFGNKVYRQDSGEKLYRRSLYTFWRRIIAPTMFFDNASRQTCTVNINRTNTPLHSLQTLNNVAYVEAARTLAEFALKNASDDAARVDMVMRRVLARQASEPERNVLVAGLARTRQQYADAREAAVKLVSQGESKRDETLDAVEHAAWTNLCLAVLNLDETLNRE